MTHNDWLEGLLIGVDPLGKDGTCDHRCFYKLFIVFEFMDDWNWDYFIVVVAGGGVSRGGCNVGRLTAMVFFYDFLFLML